MGPSTRETAGYADRVKPSYSRLQRVGVSFLAGGTAALVALLFVPVVTVATSVELSLTQLAAVGAGVGLVVLLDSVRQSSPRLVVVRTSYLVTGIAVASGLVLGAYVWTQLTPAQTQEGQWLRYTPLVPVVSGLVVGGLVGGFGTLYRRRTDPRSYE